MRNISKAKSLLVLLLVALIVSQIGCIAEQDETILSISSFSPSIGGENEIVTITGKNFSTSIKLNLIKIGVYTITPLTATDTQLTFAIPLCILNGDYFIKVIVAGKEAISTNKFRVDLDLSKNKNVIVPITQKDVVSSFITMGQTDMHPRIFFKLSDIERIKTLVSTDLAAQATYTGIINAANTLLTQPVLTYGLDAANLRIGNIHIIGNDHIPALVLAYQFTGDSRYAQRCWDQLAEMMTWPDWERIVTFLMWELGRKV